MAEQTPQNLSLVESLGVVVSEAVAVLEVLVLQVLVVAVSQVQVLVVALP